MNFQGIVEGPTEFVVGVGTGMKSLLGSAVGGAAGAASKITGAIGKGLAQLTFDEELKSSRMRRREPGASAATDIAVGGKNVVMVSSRKSIHLKNCLFDFAKNCVGFCRRCQRCGDEANRWCKAIGYTRFLQRSR